MKSVAFFTNKGGVGKTTLVSNLGAFLALERGRKVLIVDADPQSNATQYMFDDAEIELIYDKSEGSTIYDFVRPIKSAKDLPKVLPTRHSKSFGVDVVLGDPRLALLEDFLAADWSGGDVRGLKTTFLFRRLLKYCKNYDYVFFDMGPSLGSINRSVLISCQYFLIPLSIDIFSVRAIENISEWMKEWEKRLTAKLSFLDEHDDLEVETTDVNLRLLGYVSQQYTAKMQGGQRRAVRAFDKIKKVIPTAILSSGFKPHPTDLAEFEIGEVPNLHSLVPMSQVSHKPIFCLKSADGVVGAHFSKVVEAKKLFASIADRFEENIASA